MSRGTDSAAEDLTRDKAKLRRGKRCNCVSDFSRGHADVKQRKPSRQFALRSGLSNRKVSNRNLHNARHRYESTGQQLRRAKKIQTRSKTKLFTYFFIQEVNPTTQESYIYEENRQFRSQLLDEPGYDVTNQTQCGNDVTNQTQCGNDVTNQTQCGNMANYKT